MSLVKILESIKGGSDSIVNTHDRKTLSRLDSITIGNGGQTLVLTAGEIEIFGSDPCNGRREVPPETKTCRLSHPGLEGYLSRQALIIKNEDGFPKVMSSSDANEVTVWSSGTGYRATLADLVPLSGEDGSMDWKWTSIGPHYEVDIRTGNGHTVRLKYACPGASFIVEVNPKDAIPNSCVDLTHVARISDLSKK